MTIDLIRAQTSPTRTSQSLTKTVRVMLPAFNEAAALPLMLEDLELLFQQLPFDYHVTVVDDGSTDGTAEILEQAGKELPVSVVSHPTNLGLAAAMRTGIETVAAEVHSDDIIVTMDSDNTHPIEVLPRMLEMVEEGTDVVIASRFRADSAVVGVPRFRQLTSIVAGMLFKILFPIRGVRDYTCGYRAYRGLAIEKAVEHYGDSLITEQGFSCMVDLLLKMSRLGLRFGEVPMVLRYDRKVGASKLPVANTIAATLKLAIRRRLGILD